jgi:hypothetical protein
MTASSVISRSEGFCCKRGHPAILPINFFPAHAVLAAAQLGRESVGPDLG